MRLSPPMDNIVPCCLRQKDTFAECGNDLYPWSPGCQEIVGQHCMDPANVTSPLCQSFCSVIDNKRFCDTAMETYCATSAGQADPLCSCINAVARGSPIPGCFDSRCSASGYKNFDQATQAQNCPSFCGTVISCSGSGDCVVDHNSIVTHCLGKNTGSSAGYAQKQAAKHQKPSRPWLYFVYILAVVLILAVGLHFAH
ncbi:uncharacterized protein ACA1_304350 [Acanthamoeba castellanii str. Neff]|uniref:Uncharacterized protein n=1 Tax=Acanthamoeba castellanii (strain ATCC 30010 / Neff) TaxID=1257118 RepID=L8GWM6_ACACF|nr:uncharacterized protein ACA1_304350 [Acanthamoeba castellanii str. Neff]ELR16993.1 hypothetical protein ACA1_304350 [Acanthamoeba castellanii str. Neff]